MDALRFRSQKEKHELSHLYEVKTRNMGNPGRNGGEHYTPRPLIRAMIAVVKSMHSAREARRHRRVEEVGAAQGIHRSAFRAAVPSEVLAR